MTNKLKKRGRLAAMICAGFLSAGIASAQGEIEVRSAPIDLKDPNVAAQRLAGTQPVRSSYVVSERPVARFPTVVLGSASYQMTGTVIRSGALDPSSRSANEIAAVDLLPAFVTGDSLLNVAENFPGDPTQAGTIGNGSLPGTVTTDGIRFTLPVTSRFTGIAGPGSSPGIAGPGVIPTQGVILPGGTQTGLQSQGTVSGSPTGSGTAGTGQSSSAPLRLRGNR